MVRALHAAGIEVILDVVYNHTGEAKKRPDAVVPRVRQRAATTGSNRRTGPLRRLHRLRKTLDLRNAAGASAPSLTRSATGSEEMHVDGFRFDLAPALGRGTDESFNTHAAFFARAAHQDPTLARGEAIAEPWDLGPDGYRVGRFPPPGRVEREFRDTVRHSWRGDHGDVRGAGHPPLRLGGSLRQTQGRRPQASITFVTSHDGFTLGTSRLTHPSTMTPTVRRTGTGASQQPELELRTWRGRPTTRTSPGGAAAEDGQLPG